MTYEEYIASPRWAALRQEALARDGYRCRGCDTAEGLEVHHRRYGDPLGTESVDDLTTLCGGSQGCHHAITTIIRRRRYGGRRYDIAPMARLTPGNTERSGVPGLPAFEFPAYRRIGVDLPQRPASQSARSDGEGAQAGQRQAGQD